jgi:hypothetical protein
MFFFPYPALTPQRGERALGTYWANLWSRLTALGYSRGCAFVLPYVSMPERKDMTITISLDKGEQKTI